MHYSDLSTLMTQVAAWKSNGQKIVFTNGVFDILHVGHVDYLTEAAALGDILIVGINDDASVKKLNKGPERPIHDEAARSKVVAALKPVGATIIFSEETPIRLIEHIQPDVLVKGGDYDPNEIDPTKKTYMVGSKEVNAYGGKVIVIPLTAGYSTTNAVNKMRGNA